MHISICLWKFLNYDKDSAKEIIEKAEAIMPKDDNLSAARILIIKSAYELRESNLDLAEEYSQYAVDLLETTVKVRETAEAYGNLGIVKRRKGDFDGAMKYALLSLRVKDSLGTEPDGVMAKDYITIGSIYGDIENLPESNAYFLKARDIYVKNGNDEFAAFLNTNLGINYSLLANYEKSLELLGSALTFFELNNYTFYSCNVYIELGKTYLKMEQLSKAEDLF